MVSKRQKKMRAERGFKGKKLMTLSQMYDWWNWVRRFCLWFQDAPIVVDLDCWDEEEAVKIETFGQFCDWAKLYKQIRII